MDEDLILHEIVKSLAFEIEAVNQDNVLKWTTTNGTPLNVKVRVRNKDEPRLIQRGAIPVPRIGITAPEKLRLISSDQTILSFNVYLEGGLQKDPKPDNGFKKFNIGSCLGTYSDDEGPYLPGSSELNALESDSCSKSGSDIFKKNVSPVLDSANTAPRDRKTFFGKCKPGGCLDPPFDEENYAYSLSNSDHKENIQLELTKLEDTKNTKSCQPGGCLDPPFSEDTYPYTNLRVQQQETEIKSQFTKDKKQALGKKSSEDRVQHKTKNKKTIKNHEDSKNLTDIYARISKEDSIITYPTDVSSNETLYDQNPNKKMTIKSNDDEAQKQSYDYPVSYFVPPKDVTRNKDDERRYSRRLSSDTINKSSKQGTVHHEANKTKSIEPDYMPPNALRSKDIHEENLKTNCTDDVALQSYHANEKDVVATEKENPGPGSEMETPSRVLTYPKKNGSYKNLPSTVVYKERESRDLKPTESNSNHEMPHFISQGQTVSPADNDKSNHVKPRSLDENIKIPDWQTRRDMPIIKGADKEVHDKLPQSQASYITSIQTEGLLDAQTEKLDTDVTKQPKIIIENSKFSKTKSPIKGNSTSNLSCDIDGISKNILVAEATIPVLTTATLALSEKQSIRLNDKPNIELDSSIIEKDKTSIIKMCSEDFIKNTSKQKLQSEHEESISVSPQRILSSENNEFDVSSEHSIDSKHELSNTVEPRKQENTSGHRDKQELLAETLNSKSIGNVIISKNVPRDYIKVDPEVQTKRTSVVLQKKPFIARHNLDIEQDDINKTAPLKRKTFTVVSSNTSMQKREDNEELPENITDVYLKTTDKSQLGSPDSTVNITNISDTNNKNPESKISLHQKSVPDKTNYLYPNFTDDTVPTTIIEKTKEKENTFKTEFDENQSHILSGNVTNINPANNHTKPLDSIPNEKKIITYPLPIDVRDIQSNIDDCKSVLTVQSHFKIEILESIYQDRENTNANYKAIESLHKPEIIHDLNEISDEAKKNRTGNILMEKVLLNKSSKDSLQNAYYDNGLHAKASVSDKSAGRQKPEYVDLGKRESEKTLNIDSNIYLPNEYTERRSKTVTDGKFVDDSIRELLPENTRDLYPKNNIDDKSALVTDNHEEYKFIAINDVEIKNTNTSSDNLPIDISQTLNIDSNTYLPNEYTERRSKTVTDGKFVDDSIRELLPETTRDLYPKNNIDDKSALVTENHEEYKFVAINDVEIKNTNTSSDNLPIDISQKPLTNNKNSDDAASNSIYLYKNYDNFNLDAIQVAKPEYVQDHDIMTNQTNDKTEQKDLDYENLDKAKNPNFIPNITPENVEYLQAQTADDADIDRRNEKYELLDTRRNENPVQIELTENISEKSAHDMEDRNYELIKETESFTKYSSHSGGYSDLISGVLSNISENKEEEEKNTVQNKFFDETIQRHENIVPLDTKAYRDHGAIDNKLASISKESESIYKLPSSIESSVSTLKEIHKHMIKETKPEAIKNITSSFDNLKQRSDTYETYSAKLNIARDGVFLDNTTSIIDQPSQYQSSQAPASIHDLIGLNKNNSRAKPVGLTGSSTHYKQPNLTDLKVEEYNIFASDYSLRNKSPLYLDMSFCSYVNDNKQRIVQTQSPLIESQTPINGTVTIVKTLIRQGHEIRIPVDNDNDISFNILDKELKDQTRNSNVGLPVSQSRREKHVVDRAKKQNDVLNKNLSLLYESELIPLHTIIKDLTQEVNKLATKQETLQMRMRNIKRSKSLRLIPVVKRCGCRRI